jgi:UDP-N-acetylmuramoylalanine--D-glutamate ligase
MFDLTGKRVVVVGLGVSGIAACRLCLARGGSVIGTDTRTVPPPGLEGIELVLGKHASLDRADLIVVSPGVPMFPELRAALERGTPVWGEIELAVRAMRHPAPVVAIGGTNGKSTTTSLVGALLEASRKRTFVGGNLGEPLASHADDRFDVLVLEVSSFQLERVDAFHPTVSALLNITPDHLDRYASEAEYADAKGNAFVRQTEDDLAVVPVSDPICLAQAKRGRAKIVTFGPGGDVDVRADAIVDGEQAYPRARIALQGGHNALNVAAALATVRPFAIAPDVIASVLADFRGLAHRMSFVRELRGVRFYDDSKGTNVGAAVTAVRGIAEKHVVLVAGGKDKGGSYAPLADALRERGRAAVLIGEAAPLIADAIGDVVPVSRASTMKEAVRSAAELAHAGDAVLLSPACSSFDMFKDYKDRGDAFVRAVMELS